jgi:hypothetical protein
VEDLSSGNGLPGCGPGGPSVGSLEALQEVEFLSILQGDPIVNPGVCVCTSWWRDYPFGVGVSFCRLHREGLVYLSGGSYPLSWSHSRFQLLIVEQLKLDVGIGHCGL